MRRAHDRRRLPGAWAVLLTAGSLVGSACGVEARNFNAGAITVEQPWSRATPGQAKIAAAYLVIRNAGSAPDRLVGITADGAGKVSVHTMSMSNGVMEMRPLPGGVMIPAHGRAVLEPGAEHLMLEDLKHPLRQGDKVPAVLTFELAGAVPVEFEVQAIGARGPAEKDGASAPAAGKPK